MSCKVEWRHDIVRLHSTRKLQLSHNECERTTSCIPTLWIRSPCKLSHSRLLFRAGVSPAWLKDVFENGAVSDACYLTENEKVHPITKQITNEVMAHLQLQHQSATGHPEQGATLNNNAPAPGLRSTSNRAVGESRELWKLVNQLELMHKYPAFAQIGGGLVEDIVEVLERHNRAGVQYAIKWTIQAIKRGCESAVGRKVGDVCAPSLVRTMQGALLVCSENTPSIDFLQSRFFFFENFSKAGGAVVGTSSGRRTSAKGARQNHDVLARTGGPRCRSAARAEGVEVLLEQSV